jgi:hypothetical protein
VISCKEGLIGPGEIVLSAEWVNASDDAALLATVRRMTELSNHPYLIETHCGGISNFDSIEDFLAAFRDAQIRTASVEKKQELSAVRRNQFSVRHPELELALIERDGYVCSHPDCKVTSDLTIDHVVALSKGGTDELANLCFLCRSHNSVKGDK